MEEKITSRSVSSKRIGRMIKDNNSVIILVVMLLVGFVLVNILSGGGFSNGFYNVWTYSAQYGIVCLGLGLVMITGNIDLSIGYIAALAGVVFVGVFNALYGATASIGLALAVAIVSAMLVGGVCGLFNGFVITKIGVSPLIATIATNYIYEGFVYNYARESFTPVEKDAIQWIAKTRIFGFKFLTPMVILTIIIIALAFLWMYKTGFGNRIQLVGDNPEAASYAGINVSNTVLVTYIILGLCAGLTGFYLVAFNGQSIYTQGTALSTLPISCCVIGGIKMTGGKGTAVHILIGVVIMRIISEIMKDMYWASSIVNLVTGLLLLAVLIIDRFTSVKGADD